MKTKNKKNKVNIVTLGCSKNVVDSEVILTQLRGNKVDAHHESADDANVIIVNTCGFIDRAKEESVNTILAYAEQKTQGLIDKLFVTGCLSERYAGELMQGIPEVDAWFGTMQLPELLHKFNADYKKDLVGERIPSTDAHYAYLKISEGCDRPCSFCAIPMMRGKHISRPMEELVKEAQWLAKRGVKELMLIAQDLTYYGLDIYKGRKLADLLLRLSDVDGLEWIRLHYAYPSGFPTEVLKVMRDRENICKYLDMPLQHISDPILEAMRRGTTRQKTYDLIEKIRQEVPGIALRTTLITGYPGETAKDHKELVRFVEDIRFDRLGVFTYSHEEYTHAFLSKDSVSAKTKEKRQAEIMEVQQGISLELNQAKVDRVFRVMVDRKEGETYFGRTEADSPEVDNEVLITGSGLPLGQIAQIRITDATEFDLFGEPVQE